MVYAGLVSLTSSPYSSELFVLRRGWSAETCSLSIANKHHSLVIYKVCIVVFLTEPTSPHSVGNIHY